MERFERRYTKCNRKCARPEEVALRRKIQEFANGPNEQFAASFSSRQFSSNLSARRSAQFARDSQSFLPYSHCIQIRIRSVTLLATLLLCATIHVACMVCSHCHCRSNMTVMLVPQFPTRRPVCWDSSAQLIIIFNS